MANRNQASFAKRAREATKRVKRQAKMEERAKRNADRAAGLVPGEAVADDTMEALAPVTSDE